ncbi:MAG: TetR/AcrR family transcriptional regulator [Sphingobium phenoxybenzoativorans]
MTAKINPKGRGRPRGFDVDAALGTAQALFHEHGYDAVGVAAITEALGINPPSFYAAFGSKAGLFEQVLERYSACALPLEDILAPGRPPAEALAKLLEAAARFYAADPHTTGCLVLESARASGDPHSAAKAQALKAASRDYVRAFVARTHAGMADLVADYVVSMMSGLSAGAREGWSAERLGAVARMSAPLLAAMLA